MASLRTSITISIDIEYHCTYSGFAGRGASLSSPGEPPEAAEFLVDEVLYNGQKITLSDEDYASLDEVIRDEWDN